MVDLQPVQYRFEKPIAVSMGYFKQMGIGPMFDFPDEIFAFQWNGGKHLFVGIQSIADKIPKRFEKNSI